MSYAIGVLDDDASILRALRRLLGAAGFIVKTFASGEELMGSDDLRRIDCLVIDLQLAGLNGLQVHECLVQSQQPIPIVFITAHDDEVTCETVNRIGNCRYLRKPFDEEALLRAIHSLLAAA